MYAVYDDEGIWQIGDTPEDAIRRTLDAAECTAEEYVAEFGPIMIAPISPRLAYAIERLGFDCWHMRPDGTLDLDDADILAIVEAAYDYAGPAGDWTSAVDTALAAHGIESGPELDGTDPWAVARLADGRIISRDDAGNWSIGDPA